jgi:B12-binding domain/radical SAM domain protein
LADISIVLASNADRLRAAAAASVKQHGRSVVALSVMTCQFAEMQRVVKQLRSDYGSLVTIVAGGPHVTACAAEVRAAGVDVAFRGEGEEDFPGLIRKVAAGEELHAIEPGASFVDIDKFHSISPKRGMFGPIEITRGCAFACSYCQTSHIFGIRLRHRSIANIVRQAELLRSINRKVVRLLSPNAFSYGSPDGRNLNLHAVRELLSALRKTVTDEGRVIFGHFPSEARPEHITASTLDLLKEFADNDEIVVGAQSGSQKMLDFCNRSHTVESILSAVSLARQYGYKVIVDFIFGLPGESASDARETLAVMNEVVRMGARIHPHIFAPLPQTAFGTERPGSISPVIRDALENLKSRRGIYETHTRPVKEARV